MSVILILIVASLGLAFAFLTGFIWAVKTGQFEDTYTPSMRILLDEENQPRAEVPTLTRNSEKRRTGNRSVVAGVAPPSASRRDMEQEATFASSRRAEDRRTLPSATLEAIPGPTAALPISAAPVLNKSNT